MGMVDSRKIKTFTEITTRTFIPKLPGSAEGEWKIEQDEAIEKMAPSDEMFADGIRLAGLDLLSRLHIREGMTLCVSTLEWRWGNDFRKRLEFLKRYGVHAKEVIPQLRKKRLERPDEAKSIDKAIADIEAAKDTPTLVSLKDFIARASAGSNDTKKGTP